MTTEWFMFGLLERTNNMMQLMLKIFKWGKYEYKTN